MPTATDDNKTESTEVSLPDVTEVSVFMHPKLLEVVDNCLATGLFGFSRPDCVVRLIERGLMHEDVQAVLMNEKDTFFMEESLKDDEDE